MKLSGPRFNMKDGPPPPKTGPAPPRDTTDGLFDEMDELTNLLADEALALDHELAKPDVPSKKNKPVPLKSSTVRFSSPPLALAVLILRKLALTHFRI